MINIQHLLARAVAQHASDLHLSPTLSPRLRVDGDLIFLADLPPLEPMQLKNSLYELLDTTQQVFFDQHHELDFCLSLPKLANFRVNLFQQQHGIAGVFRLIPAQIPSLEQPAYPPILRTLAMTPAGLMLITGQTGSGKSTTLAAMIHYLNQHQSAHIITIEDPIEFTHQSMRSLISQRQIKRDTKSFSSALRAALREDPDVIVIGEMRDLATIRLALTAAETGHLVLATLHAYSAPRAISRIIDVFPSEEKNLIRNLVAESLQGVICQRLIKKQSGGRDAIFEIMLGNAAIRNLIREDKIAQMYHVLQTGKAQGMCTFDQAMQDLIH